MPAVNCKYHPTTPARWDCGHCHISYCPSCVTEKDDQDSPDCPVCKRALESLGSENLITPFWLRMKAFFVYPAYPTPIILILLLSAFAFLIRYVPGWNIDIKIILWEVPRNFFLVLPFLMVFLKYSQTVLDDTAHGHLKPRRVNSEKLFGNALLVLKLLAILLIFKLFATAVSGLFGKTGYYLATILSSIGTPAAIMILAMEDRFLSAMNPVTIYSVMIRIGLPYFIMFAMFYLLDIAQNFLLVLLAQYIDPSLSFAAFAFVTMYFYLIIFNMMGYVLYQHHEILGFDLDVGVHEQYDNSQCVTIVGSREMRAVEILIHEGKTDQAALQLEALITSNPGNLEARERMLKLLRLVGNRALHREQAQKFISYLIGENRIGNAAQVFRDGYPFDKQLKPAKAFERLEMAKYFQHKGNAKLAMVVLNDLHRDFPSFEGIPESYLMVAKLLSEHLNDDERAVQILKFLIKNYSTHPLTGEVMEYMQVVQRISNH